MYSDKDKSEYTCKFTAIHTYKFIFEKINKDNMNDAHC